MNLCWFLALCSLHITSTSATAIIKEWLQNKREPGGILGALAQPQVPKFPLGIQIGSQANGGSFGFGFGLSRPTNGANNQPPKEEPEHHPPPETEKDKFGGSAFGISFGFQVSKPTRRVHNEPPRRKPPPPPEEHRPNPPETSWDEKDKHRPPPPETSWDQKDKVGPRPNWEDDTVDKPSPDRHDGEEDSHMENIKDDDSLPGWDDIGEDEDDKSEDFMDKDLVKDGIIGPRRPRVRRRVESKIYFVPLKFMSNARPFKMHYQNHRNALTKEGH